MEWFPPASRSTCVKGLKSIGRAIFTFLRICWAVRLAKFGLEAAPFLLQTDAFSLSDSHSFNKSHRHDRQCSQWESRNRWNPKLKIIISSLDIPRLHAVLRFVILASVSEKRNATFAD